MVRPVVLFLISALLPLLLSACAQPANPSFPLSVNDARDAVREMRAHPRELKRPLVVIGGFMDPNISAPLYKRWFGDVTRNSKIIPVSVCFCGSFAECRAKVIKAVDAACPTNDPERTVDVDVVGASLGGLVGRFAAAPSSDPKHPRRLSVVRLFSISSPHSGSMLAGALGFSEYLRDMQPNSKFLRSLARADSGATYELYPYVLLHDEIVGTRYAAPPGMNPFWLSSPLLLPAHTSAMADPRILADIARRLRGEEPFTRMPPAPLPS